MTTTKLVITITGDKAEIDETVTAIHQAWKTCRSGGTYKVIQG